jgi:hypothetical protein
MSRPALIPHKIKPLFHNKKSCIDIRGGKVHSIKANTNNRTWFNEVNNECATISVNPRTNRDNNLVYNSKEPFHVLSFGCGADTYYWGRYKCVGGQGLKQFKLVYVDNGSLEACLPPGVVNHRSSLETSWSEAFEKQGITATFEPATMKLSDGTEYTPDFWLPESSTFIEIKGPNPTKREFQKCTETRRLGFNIKMFHGSPSDFDVYDWSKPGKMVKHEESTFYRYLHPTGKRKRRGIHNIVSMKK